MRKFAIATVIHKCPDLLSAMIVLLKRGQLETLQLGSDFLTSEQINSRTEALSSNKIIRVLDLGWNNISPVNAEKLKQLLQTTNLVALRLDEKKDKHGADFTRLNWS